MGYDCLKILHVVSATLLLTSMGYSGYLWFVSPSNFIGRIQTQTWAVIVPFAIFQLGTGFTMISLKHYDFNELWIVGSVIGFIIVIFSWFAFIYFLLTTTQPSSQLFRRLQFLMLSVCTLSLLTMIFLMANKVIGLYG